ncbi:unnamed protein product [Lymnaea stagnalis]|uniref:Cysteine protease n=1 Tax=Lymnaea stagnalis TaxID=6523 RepID=A0AAV2I735_LYMST
MITTQAKYNAKTAKMNLSTFTYESGPLEYEDFPLTAEPVYILGEVHSALHDRDDLKNDIKSRIWITYRRNFQNIGGTGPSSDQGWGCMLRCGQMMLAQGLVLRHLGRGWRWRPHVTDDTYWKILKMFEDKKMATYSIHQIASMGEAEGKAIGQWFGPNTIAQVLKRISVYDDWSGIAIHVALDNVVIIDDILNLCKPSQKEQSKSGLANENIEDIPEEELSKFVNDGPQESKPSCTQWKPLLLIIPLRLGLTDINPIYFESLKKCFKLKQSVGIIGGKPNHAHWFIGFVDKELIYLDPHTTQNVVDLEDRHASDATYHCTTPASRMSFSKLDPSIALGFYCGTERDFDEWCLAFTVQDKSCRPMFEIRKDAPKAWPSEETVPIKQTKESRGFSLSDFMLYDGSTGSGVDDEEFEII